MKRCPPLPELSLERSACPQCGAKTAAEASNICKATQDMDGDYHCAGIDCPEDDAGYLLFPTAASLAAQDEWFGKHYDCFEGCVVVTNGEHE